MRGARLSAAVVLSFFVFAVPTRISLGDDTAERAHKLHFSSIVLDTHADTTQRFFSKTFDLANAIPKATWTFRACAKAA
jgi:hypothetical protein